MPPVVRKRRPLIDHRFADERSQPFVDLIGLVRTDRPILRAVDLGCGSGLLALAALRLGASRAAAVDIDPLAVRATGDNAALNGLPLPVTQGSAEALAGLQGTSADLLLCNILAPVIEALAPSFEQILSPSGQGLLSGLLVDQVPSLQQTLTGCGWQAELIGRQEPWGLMRIRRARVVT